MKVPAILATAVICLILGGGIGALVMDNKDLIFPKPEENKGQASPGADSERNPASAPRNPQAGGPGGRPDGPGGPGGGGPGGPGGGGPGGPGGGGRGPSPKVQLAALVTKIDQLAKKPLTVTLTDEEKAKLAEQLKGLSDMEALEDDEAKKRLDAVLEIVKDDKEAMEAAGYRWPGQGGGGGGGGRPQPPPANPFKEGESATHLKSLQELVAKPK